VQILRESVDARKANAKNINKQSVNHPCRKTGIFDYSPLLDMPFMDASKDVLFDLMHTLANVVRNFIKLMKGTRAPDAKVNANAAAAADGAPAAAAG
jgi:hypothetical protein